MNWNHKVNFFQILCAHNFIWDFFFINFVFKYLNFGSIVFPSLGLCPFVCLQDKTTYARLVCVYTSVRVCATPSLCMVASRSSLALPNYFSKIPLHLDTPVNTRTKSDLLADEPVRSGHFSYRVVAFNPPPKSSSLLPVIQNLLTWTSVVYCLKRFFPGEYFQIIIHYYVTGKDQ
jgi:hypothetical protein